MSLDASTVTPDQSAAPAPPDSANANPQPSSDVQPPSIQSVMASAPPSQQPQQPDVVNNNPPAPTLEKPSLWRQVLQGALVGLANSGGSTSFAGGAARGAAGELQQTEQDREQQRQAQAQAQQQLDQHMSAQYGHQLLQIKLASLHQEFSQLPPTRQAALLQQRAETNDQLFKAGAIVPVGPATDYATALNQVSEKAKTDPAGFYTAEPAIDDKGEQSWQAVQHMNTPIQADVTLPSVVDGKKIVIPKGTMTGKQIGDLMTNQALAQTRSLLMAQQQIAVAKEKAALKPPAAEKAEFFEGTDPDGNQTAGTPDELKAAGVQHFVKMPALVQTQTLAARELTSPDGLFATARKQILDLQAKNELGPVASRWNNFWAGQGLNGDQQAFRGTLNLIATKLMQAHMGNRGGKDALEHFAALVPENSTPQALMATLNNEYGYVSSLAKRPKATGGK